MLRSLFFLLTCFLSFTLFAQKEKHSEWNFSVSKNNVTDGEVIDLVFSVSIDATWYVYSSDFDPNLGPLVASFTFQKNNSFDLVGGIKAIKPKKKFDDIYGGDVTYFTEKGEFRQKVRILKKDAVIKGTIEYQECTEVDGKCIQHEEDFSFTGFTVSGKDEKTTAKSEIKEVPVTVTKTDPTDSVSKNSIADPGEGTDSLTKSGSNTQKVALSGSSNDNIENKSFALIFWLSFLGGLVALATPCVYPMIPMTISLFTNNSSTRAEGIKKALIYGISIIAIYTLVGTVIAFIFGADFANWVSTHWLPNILFFLIFLVFGISFLGMFEITLPSRFVNKVDKEADKGGYYGIFFMALTLVVVSFSCTAPIAGSILVQSSRGNVGGSAIGMLGFSLAFAIPFSIFALFPGMLKSLPKSGGWLNSVKVILGFLELALALKFLSVADQVYHWGILDRDIFLILWIAIFSLMGFYLLGKIKLSHDSDTKHVSVPRLFFAILTFSFVVYLIPGLLGAPLKALSGFLPPMSTQDFNLSSISASQGDNQVSETVLCAVPKYSDKLKFPHAIKGYFDYQQAIDCAKKLNKPLFIDFTGHGCVNCRKMEENVWVDPEVLKRLKNDFVVVALYIDEPTELPENQWYTSKDDGRVKKTVGKQNADFQVTRFNNNAQPYYVILDPNGELLVQPRAYDLSIPKFIQFLDEAKKAFQDRKSS
jgi:thiol:disulfide interchange protein